MIMNTKEENRMKEVNIFKRKGIRWWRRGTECVLVLVELQLILFEEFLFIAYTYSN